MRHDQVIQTFASRQNLVQLVKDPDSLDCSVCKHFADFGRCRLETKMLQLLSESGVQVPAVLETGAGFIRMAYISGPTLCEYIEQQEIAGQPVGADVLSSLADQLQRLYQSPAFRGQNLIRHDVNLRNCLVHDGQIYLVDFESVEPGQILTDIGGMIAFFLTYDPPFSNWKIAELARIRDLLLRRHPFDAAALTGEVKDWLGKLGLRRNADYIRDSRDSVALVAQILLA